MHLGLWLPLFIVPLSGYIDTLARRSRTLVEYGGKRKPETAELLEKALIRGAFERGEIALAAMSYCSSSCDDTE
jgi:hypothetical protein